MDYFYLPDLVLHDQQECFSFLRTRGEETYTGCISLWKIGIALVLFSVGPETLSDITMPDGSLQVKNLYAEVLNNWEG